MAAPPSPPRHGVGLNCDRSRGRRNFTSQKFGDVELVSGGRGGLRARRDRTLLRRLDRAQIDVGCVGKFVSAEDVHRRVMALDQRAAFGVPRRFAPSCLRRCVPFLLSGDELGVERDLEVDLGQIRAGDLAPGSTGFLTSFEARRMGTSCCVRTQNRC
jgi:hypothetical protein